MPITLSDQRVKGTQSYTLSETFVIQGYILFSFCKEMHNGVCLAPILHYMYMQATLLVMRNLLLFLHVSLQSKYLEYQVYLPTTNRK